MLHALSKSKPDVYRLDLLLNLAQFHIFKPGEFQVDFDSAIVYINEASVLNRTLKSSDAHGYQLLTESILAREKGQKEEAKKMTEQAVIILESGTNKSYLGAAYYELAWHYDYSNTSELPEKIRLIEQCAKAFEQARDTRRKARALEMLGDLYVINQQSSKAIPVLKQALAIYDSVDDLQLQGVYVILGRAYRRQAEYDQSLFYLLRALKTAHALGDTSMQLCNINNMLASLYGVIRRYDVAVRYTKDALETARKFKDDNAVFFLSVNLSLGYYYIGQPRMGLDVLDSIPQGYRSSLNGKSRAFLEEVYLRSYLSLKQYDKAQKLIRPLLTIAQGNSLTTYDRALIHRLAATYYFHTNQYAKARACLRKNRELILETNLELIYDSRIWYKLDSAEGDFRSAFRNLLFYKTKMDSILSESRIRQLEILGVEYETAIKEDSIKLKDKNILLLRQENRLQEVDLEQANLIKNVTIGGTILAFIIICLLYRLYLQKQKGNKVITEKNVQLQHFLNEKEWLLKEIHHRVKNNLQIVMSLLNSQSAYIDNKPALAAIHDSQHRVQAISLIHQKLYNTENVSSIDISVYVRELVSYLSDCFNTGPRIRFDVNIQRLETDVGQAVPLGLILNEAITNAIKYAFPNGREGIITISLSNNSSNHYSLCISDNGVGIPLEYQGKRTGSLGMSLIAGLSEDLDGTFSIESNNGTTLRITFSHNFDVKHSDRTVELFASSG